MATFATIASTDPQSRFDILLAAAGFVDSELPGTDLVATLSDASQSLTVFAPTDTAFGNLAAALGFAGDPTDEGAVTTFFVGLGATTLRDVILYHVVGTPLTAAQIGAQGTINTLGGGTITADLPTLVDLEPDLLDPSVTTADIMADNGILHIIDQVLLPTDLAGNTPPSITGTVAASGSGFDSNSADFDILLAAVTAAGLGGALDDANADLTVFAPNDAAFVGIAQALGFSGSDESGAFSFIVEALTLLGGGDPIPLLTQILTYHVANGSLQASQVLSSTTITTLQGGDLTVNGTSLVDADPDIPDPSIVATDILASNGVIHVIDSVLIPADILMSDGSNDVQFVIGDSAAANVFLGADNDLIDGNGGNDTIGGGAGDDVILGGGGNDLLFGGAGVDLILGGNGSDFIRGGSGNDNVAGENGNDAIVTGAGNDLGTGGAGNDSVFGGTGNDGIFGGTGNDFIGGGAGDDTVGGGSGNDTIFGHGDNDTLYGGAGEDILYGGSGNNDVTGGADADTFVIAGTTSFTRIQDFENGVDRIDVSALNLSGFADIQAGIAGNNPSQVFVDLGNASFTLKNVVASDLDASDFIF